MPDMDFRYRSDRSALHQFHNATVIGTRMDLRPHLRRQLVLGGSLNHRTHFGY